MDAVRLFSIHATWSAGIQGRMSALSTFTDEFLMEQKTSAYEWCLVDALLGNPDALDYAYPETLELDDYNHLLLQLTLCTSILDSIRNLTQTRIILTKIGKMQWILPLWKPVERDSVAAQTVFPPLALVVEMLSKLFRLYPSINIHTLVCLAPPGNMLFSRLADCPYPSYVRVSIGNLNQFRSAEHVVLRGHNDEIVRVYERKNVLLGPKRKMIIFIMNLFSYCSPVFIQRVISVFNLRSSVFYAQRFLHHMPMEMQDEFSYALLAIMRRAKLHTTLDYYSSLQGVSLTKGHIIELGPIPIQQLSSVLKLNLDTFYCQSALMSKAIHVYYDFIRPIVTNVPCSEQLFKMRDNTSSTTIEPRKTTMYDILILNGYEFGTNSRTYGPSGPATMLASWIHHTVQSPGSKILKLLCDILNTIFLSDDFASAVNLVSLFRFISQTSSSSIERIAKLPFFAKGNRSIINNEDFRTISTYLQLLRILIVSGHSLPESASIDCSDQFINNSKFDLSLCLQHAQLDTDLRDYGDLVLPSQNPHITKFQDNLSRQLLTLVPFVLRPDNDRILLQGEADRYPEHVLAVTTGGGFFSFSYTLLNCRLSKMFAASDEFYLFMRHSIDKIRRILTYSSKQTKHQAFADYINHSVPESHVPKLLIKYFPSSFGMLEQNLYNSNNTMQFIMLGLILEIYATVLKRCMLQEPNPALFSAVRRLIPSLLSVRGQVERILTQVQRSCTDAGKDAEETQERTSLISVYLCSCFSNISLLYASAFGPLSLYFLNDGKWTPKDMSTTDGYVDLSIMKLNLLTQRKLYVRLDNSQLGILMRRFLELLQVDLSEEQASPYTVLMAGFMALAVGERCRFSMNLADTICAVLDESTVLIHPSAHKFDSAKIIELVGQLNKDELNHGMNSALEASHFITSKVKGRSLRDYLNFLTDISKNNNVLIALTLLAIQKQLNAISAHALAALFQLLNLQLCLHKEDPIPVVIVFPLEDFVNRATTNVQSLAFSNAILIDGQVITRHTQISKDSALYKRLSQCFIILRNMLYWEDALFAEVCSFCINFLTLELPEDEPPASNNDDPNTIEDLVSVLLSFLLLNIYGLAAANNSDATTKNYAFFGRYQLCRSKLLTRCIDLMRKIDLSSASLLNKNVTDTTVHRMIPNQNIDRLGACLPLQLQYINQVLGNVMNRASPSIQPLLAFTSELFAHIHSLYSWKDISIPDINPIFLMTQVNLPEYQVIIDIIVNWVPHPVIQHTMNFLSNALAVLATIRVQGDMTDSVLCPQVIEIASYPILINSSALLGTEATLDHFIFVPYMHVLLFIYNGTMDSQLNLHTIQLFTLLCRMGMSLRAIYGYELSAIFSSEHVSAAIETQTQLIKDSWANPDSLCLITSAYTFFSGLRAKLDYDMRSILYCSLDTIDCEKINVKIRTMHRLSDKQQEVLDYIDSISAVIDRYSISMSEICPILFGDIFLELLIDPCSTYESLVFKTKRQATDPQLLTPQTTEVETFFDDLAMFSFNEPERIARPEKVAYRPNTDFDKEYNDLQHEMAHLAKRLPNRLYAYIQNNVVPAPYKNLICLALRISPDSLYLAPEGAVVTISQLVEASFTQNLINNSTLPLLPLLLLRVSGTDAARPGGPISHFLSERYTPGMQLFSLLFIMHGYDQFRAISNDILTNLITFLNDHRMEKHTDTRIVPLGFLPAKIQAMRYRFTDYCIDFQRNVRLICDLDTDEANSLDRGRAIRYLSFLTSTFLAYVPVSMPEERFDSALTTEAYSTNPLRLLRKMVNREFRLAHGAEHDEALSQIMHRNQSILVKYCYLDITGLCALATFLNYQVIYNECSKIRSNVWRLNDLVEQEHEMIL